MRKFMPTRNSSRRNIAGILKTLSLLISLVALLSFGSICAAAVWDGTGSAGSGGSLVEITGEYWLNDVGIGDAMGYRFSIYNDNGDKVGHSIDINFEESPYALYRSYKDSKKSHVDLYRTYKATGTASIGEINTNSTESAYVFYDASIPALDSPPTIGDWLTSAKANQIAWLCAADTYGLTSNHYIIVEPIFVAGLDGNRYAMTMAEYAVYQAGQIGWTVPYGDNHVNGTYMYNIGRYTSAIWGRYLYATGNYPVFGTLPVNEAEHLALDSSGEKSILLPGSKLSRNTAENVLKYQVGMAIYTDVVSVFRLDLNGFLDETLVGGLDGFGTCDVYINGTLVADDVSDYNQFHPQGSTYEIKDIKTAAGKTYKGVYSGSLSGTLTENKDVCLKFDSDSYILGIDPNGGTYKGSSSLVITSKPYGESVSIDAPTREGHYFNGWVWSLNEGFPIDQPAIGWSKAQSIGHGTYCQNLNTSEGFTNHVFRDLSSPAYDAWNHLTLSEYSVSAGETINISGWIRVNSNTAGAELWFFHGAGWNDHPNRKHTVSSTDGEWEYFSFSRTFTEDAIANLEICTSNLKGLSGEIDFDLKGITIERDDGTIVPTTMTMPASSVTLTAQWTPIMYSVYYNGNGAGSGDMGPQTAAFGTTTVVLPNEYKREGYTFIGWNTKPDGTGNSYAPGSNILLNGDVTLYAMWSVNGGEDLSPISGYLRFIQLRHFGTLEENSKWRQDPLKSYLEEILSEDLSDPDNCEQVWYFSADEYEKVHEWCLEHEKGSDTNEQFLIDFAGNRTK